MTKPGRRDPLEALDRAHRRTSGEPLFAQLADRQIKVVSGEPRRERVQDEVAVRVISTELSQRPRLESPLGTLEYEQSVDLRPGP